MLRIVDFTLALVGLVFALPLLLVVMLVIRLDSPGRALFAQTRVGRDLQPFTCYKLRTMRAGHGRRQAMRSVRPRSRGSARSFAGPS